MWDYILPKELWELLLPKGTHRVFWASGGVRFLLMENVAKGGVDRDQSPHWKYIF